MRIPGCLIDERSARPVERRNKGFTREVREGEEVESEKLGVTSEFARLGMDFRMRKIADRCTTSGISKGN